MESRDWSSDVCSSDLNNPLLPCFLPTLDSSPRSFPEHHTKHEETREKKDEKKAGSDKKQQLGQKGCCNRQSRRLRQSNYEPHALSPSRQRRTRGLGSSSESCRWSLENRTASARHHSGNNVVTERARPRLVHSLSNVNDAQTGPSAECAFVPTPVLSVWPSRLSRDLFCALREECSGSGE